MDESKNNTVVPSPIASTSPSTPSIEGKGIIKKLNLTDSSLTMEHEAIPALNWPEMTMDFTVDTGVDLNQFKNQKIILELSGNGSQVIERRSVQVSAKGQTESFDLSSKKEGLYILKIINEKSVSAVKVIVAR